MRCRHIRPGQISPPPLPHIMTVHMIRDDLTTAFGFSIEQPHTGGRVFVKRVWIDSAAETAGLRAGDMVLSMDGHQLSAATPASVATMVKNAGNVLAVEVVSASEIQRFPELRGQTNLPVGPVAKRRVSNPKVPPNPNVAHWGPFAKHYPFSKPTEPKLTARRSRQKSPTDTDKPLSVSLLGTRVQAPDVWTFFLGWRRWKEKSARQGLVASYSTPAAGGPEGPGEPLIGDAYRGQVHRGRRKRAESTVSSGMDRIDSRERLSVEIGPVIPRPQVVFRSSAEMLEAEEFQRTEAALHQLRNAMQASQITLPGEIEAENRRLNELDDEGDGSGAAVLRPEGDDDDDISAIYNESAMDDADTAWDEFKSMFESAGIQLPPREPASVQDYHHHNTRQSQPLQPTAAPRSEQPFTGPPSSGPVHNIAPVLSAPPRNSTSNPQTARPAVLPSKLPPTLAASTTPAATVDPTAVLGARPKAHVSVKGIFAKKLAEVKAPHVDL
jgi:hypothetical protein